MKRKVYYNFILSILFLLIPFLGNTQSIDKSKSNVSTSKSTDVNDLIKSLKEYKQETVKIKQNLSNLKYDSISREIPNLKNKLNTLSSTNQAGLSSEHFILEERLFKKNNKLQGYVKDLVKVEAKVDSVTEIVHLDFAMLTNNNAKALIQDIADVEKENAEAVSLLDENKITVFKTTVSIWNEMGGFLAANATLSESLLIFPNNGKEVNNFIDIIQYVGIAGGIAGAYIATNNQKTGIMTSGISLSISQLLRKIYEDKKGKKALETVENLARNAALTDEVNALYKVSQTFSVQAESLYNNIKGKMNEDDWKPSPDQLNSYYNLINIRKDMNGVIRQLNAKIDILNSDKFIKTDEGGKKLVELKLAYDKAIEKWDLFEAGYVNTYNYLLNAIAKK